MGRWRVGTRTLGFSLIVMGIILLTSLVGGYSLGEYIVKLWPLILIFLGAEVLINIYRNPDGTGQVKYDFFSMIMIFIIFFCSMGTYYVTSSGLVKEVVRSFRENRYSVVLPKESITVGAHIKKVVIHPAPWCRIEFVDSQDQTLHFLGRGHLVTTGKEEADTLAQKEVLRYEEVGDVLYLELPGLDTDGRPYNNQLEATLSIPQGLQVEVKGWLNGQRTEVILGENAVKGEWIIDSVQTVMMRVNDQTDYRAALTGSAIDHFGDDETLWKVQHRGSEVAEANATFGQGTHSLVINANYVEVIRIPNI